MKYRSQQNLASSTASARLVVPAILISMALFSQWNVDTTKRVGRYTQSWLYRDLFSGFSVADITTFSLFTLSILIYSVQELTLRHSVMKVTSIKFGKFGLFVFLVTCISIFVALFNGVSGLLFALRPLVLLALTFLTIYLTFRRQPWLLENLLRHVSQVMALLGLPQLISLLGVQTAVKLSEAAVSTYDGILLHMYVLCALFGIAGQLLHGSKTTRIDSVATIINISVVLTSFRRAHWAELAIGTYLVLRAMRGSTQSARGTFETTTELKLLGGLLAVIGLAAFSPLDYVSRLQSMLVFKADSRIALGGSDNYDHIQDVITGFQVATENWLFGIGLGGSFRVSGISFKSVSYGVHNAPLTVWIWFGIFGLIAWLYSPLFMRKILSTETALNLTDKARLTSIAVRSWYIAIFLVTCLFTDWPFSSAQFAIGFGVICASAMLIRQIPPTSS